MFFQKRPHSILLVRETSARYFPEKTIWGFYWENLPKKGQKTHFWKFFNFFWKFSKNFHFVFEKFSKSFSVLFWKIFENFWNYFFEIFLLKKFSNLCVFKKFSNLWIWKLFQILWFRSLLVEVSEFEKLQFPNLLIWKLCQIIERFRNFFKIITFENYLNFKFFQIFKFLNLKFFSNVVSWEIFQT